MLNKKKRKRLHKNISRKGRAEFCVKCGKHTRNGVGDLCSTCHRANYKIELYKDWWGKIKITPAQREEIRLLLLRKKYSYDTALDVLTLVNYYYQYKPEVDTWTIKMAFPDYEKNTIEHTYQKIAEQLKWVIIK